MMSRVRFNISEVVYCLASYCPSQRHLGRNNKVFSRILGRMIVRCLSSSDRKHDFHWTESGFEEAVVAKKK